MRTCCVVLPLVPMHVGDRIDRRAWAPHITLVGDLRMPDGATDTAAAVLRALAPSIDSIHAAVGDEDLFGPDRSVPVDLVEAPGLRSTHERVLAALEAQVTGLQIVAPVWTRDGYRPHRTVSSGDRPSRGDVVEATAVALVELDPAGRPGSGVVLARWDLGVDLPVAEVDEEDVLRVLGALQESGVPAWVIGGWGVDALVGAPTRPHHDLDLLTDADGTEAAIRALERIGYVLRFVWSENRWSDRGARLVPSAFVAVDGSGREVDVHTVGLLDGRVEPRSASTVPLPHGALSGFGRIGGAAVPCASAAAQLVMHTGYPLPQRQVGDVERLRRLG